MAETASSCHSVASSDAGGTAELAARLRSEFWPILEEVREKAPQRFSHVREALRIVDVDYDGCITKDEMRAFFRAFGVAEREADRLYEKLAKHGPGGANYQCFVQTVGPYLDLPGVVAATQPQNTGRGSRPSSAHSRPRSARNPPAPASPLPRVSTRDGHKALQESSTSSCPSPRAPATPRSGRPQSLESPRPVRRSSRPPSLAQEESADCSESIASARRSPCAPLSARRGQPQRLESPVSARHSPCPLVLANRNGGEEQLRPSSARRSPRPLASSRGDPKESARGGSHRASPAKDLPTQRMTQDAQDVLVVWLARGLW